MLYQLFCELCAYKRLTDGTDVGDLVEVRTSPIPRGAPTLDPEMNISVPPAIRQQKRFKCPNCGRVIKAKRLKS